MHAAVLHVRLVVAVPRSNSNPACCHDVLLEIFRWLKQVPGKVKFILQPLVPSCFQACPSPQWKPLKLAKAPHQSHGGQYAFWLFSDLRRHTNAFIASARSSVYGSL